MKEINQWDEIGRQIGTIQDAKNRVLLPPVMQLIERYCPPGSKVFDYGCGWGELVATLNVAGWKSDGYDLAPAMVARAREQHKELVFMDRPDLEMKLTNLSGQYKMVCSNLVLCILEEAAQQRVLSEMLQLLAPDGKLLVSICHPCFDYLPEGIVTHRNAPDNARYDAAFSFEKTIYENNISFSDYHRPLPHYSRLFHNMGLVIEEIVESLTDAQHDQPDFLIFVLTAAKASK